MRGVVAESTFSNYREIAAEKAPWISWLVPLVISAGFDPDEVLASLPPAPLLVIHGKRDHIVGDNVDVAAIDDCRWACLDLDAYAGVSWAVPGDDLTVCVEIADVRVGLFHGHQVRGQGKVQGWHDAQAGNHRPIGAADLLISGHYHSFRHEWLGPRTWVQCPSEDAGSPQYAETAGPGARRSGSVTIDVDAGTVGDIRIV